MAWRNLWTLASSQTKQSWLVPERPAVLGVYLGNMVPGQIRRGPWCVCMCMWVEEIFPHSCLAVDCGLACAIFPGVCFVDIQEVWVSWGFWGLGPGLDRVLHFGQGSWCRHCEEMPQEPASILEGGHNPEVTHLGISNTRGLTVFYPPSSMDLCPRAWCSH